MILIIPLFLSLYIVTRLNRENYQSIKMAAEPLNKSLSIAIGNSFKYKNFPSNAKVVFFQLPDKNTEEKHCIPHFTLVCILTMSKS